MLRLVAAVMVSALLLAGCSSPGKPTSTSEPVPVVETKIGTTPAPPPPAPVVGPCAITRTAANTALGYGINPDAVLGSKVSCAFSEVDSGNLSRFHYAVLEVAWQAQTTETSIGLRVNADCQGDDQPETPGQACAIGKVVGTAAPLRLVLYPDVMDRYAAVDPSVYLFTEGASVDHAFDVRISLFEKGPVPDGYTGFTLLG